MAVVIRFALGGAVEPEHGIDADFPDSLRDGSPLGPDSDFAQVFVAADFSLDRHVRTFGEGAGEVGQFAERDASMPLGPRFPLPASFFQDVLVASENTAMFVALLTFFSASLPRKPMRVILLRYIRFSCSARLSRALGSEWARLPRPEAAFLGGPARGSQNRNSAEGKAEASQTPGAARAPKQCRDKGWNRKRTRNSHATVVAAAEQKQCNAKSLARRPHRSGIADAGASREH